VVRGGIDREGDDGSTGTRRTESGHSRGKPDVTTWNVFRSGASPRSTSSTRRTNRIAPPAEWSRPSTTPPTKTVSADLAGYVASSAGG
jgi:K+-transporting ATPase c subunit